MRLEGWLADPRLALFAVLTISWAARDHDAQAPDLFRCRQHPGRRAIGCEVGDRLAPTLLARPLGVARS